MSLTRRIVSLAAMLPVLLTPFCVSAQDGSEGWRLNLRGNYQRYDLTEQGPLVGVSFSF